MRAALVAFLSFVASSAPACGPDFPNSLLDRGDDAVLTAPRASFRRELERLQLAAPRFRAVLSTNDYAGETADADLTDLRAALRKAGVPAAEREVIVRRHEAERARLSAHRAAVEAWSHSDTGEWVDGQYVLLRKKARPVLSAETVTVIEELPGEFADYFRGSIAWHASEFDEARAAWEALLARPEPERHYRSTWAAYMLGKSWEDEDNDLAIEYFEQVRALAKAGFADRLGLAAASLGWEARIYLEADDFVSAIELYLEQLAAGGGDVESLRICAARALKHGGDALRPLAANPLARRVITAYVISTSGFELPNAPPEEADLDSDVRLKAVVVRWLEAVEAAGVKDVESAEQLALAAYQAGQWSLAQRWINRARATPTAQWLQTKLLLRAGKLREAATLLTQVAPRFPLDPPNPDQPTALGLKDSLFVEGHSYAGAEINAASQLLGELGVLHLARREYTEALDALLRSSFWMDAAYVAERVLKADELKSYVDRHWPYVPPPPPDETAKSEETQADPAQPQFDARREIRYLLARRLMRLNRASEARDYYPADWQPEFDALAGHLKAGWDTSKPAEQRAAALFSAAKIAREKGMELLGTEVEPDWHIHDGQFEGGVWVSERKTNELATVLVPSKDEIRRAEGHTADPEERFHYRYQAASLAWEAAKLMPDNSDQTAIVLCRGGSWLKNRDPDTADLFYKSLVRRCRKTAIGEQADRMRWFPLLDEHDNLIPWRPRPPAEMVTFDPDNGADPDSAPVHAPGYWYIVSFGNSLQDVVDAVHAGHNVEITIKELLDANPGVNPAKLKVGQKIFVPSVGATNPPPATPNEQRTPPELPPVTDPNAGAVPPESSGVAPALAQSGGAKPGWDYTVRVGDSLYTIARKFSGSGATLTVKDMADANPDIDWRRLRVGQRIFIPAPGPSK